MAKKAKEPAPAEQIVPAEEPARDELAVIPVKEAESILELESGPRPASALEPEPTPTHVPAPTATDPTVGQRLRRFFGFLASLLFVLVILAAISIGLYYLLPRLYRQYVQPVQENTAELQQLRDQQEQSEQAIAGLETRLAEIEAGQAAQAQTLAALEKRVGEVESGIAAHTETLATLERMQATLRSQTDAAGVELDRQIQLLKAMELLSRARLFMYQSNFGLAELDVQTARDLLATVQPEAPKSLAEDLTAVVSRLDLSLSNLPEFPVAASDDLDIAWQILLGGLPHAQLISDATPVPGATLTPTLSASLTPTPGSTVTVTPTP